MHALYRGLNMAVKLVFTPIELIVTIAATGILAAIAVPSFE